MAANHYFIVRCAGQSTILLAKELYQESVRAWTPLWVRKIRVPRSKAHRKVISPLMPSFVFIDGRDYESAVHLAKAFRVKRFTPLLVNGAIAVASLQELRNIDLSATYDESEAELTPKVFEVGESVLIEKGPFHGKTGVVLKIGGKYIQIELTESRIKLKIPPFLLGKSTV